jgi:hypothetical protein
MRSKLTLFAAACVAALALSTPASAATILQFAQSNSSDFVSSAVSGNTTTLTTNGVLNPHSIAITISQDGIAQGVNAPAFETFFPGLGGSTALISTTGGNGPPPGQVGFNGTIVISSGPNGTGLNILTAVIGNGRLDALQGGTTASFQASNGATNGGSPVTVTLTSADPNITPLLSPPGGPSPGAVSLSLVNITPTQTGAGFTSFTAQNTGNFSTVAIPEPASFISASTALLAGLGCFGWSRRKSSKA